jgi:4-amino-4-deoxychorismate lyase
MLIETIRIDKGKVENLHLHEARAMYSASLLFQEVRLLPFAEVIKPPPEYSDVICKCRITYNQQILKVEYEPYTPKPITSLCLVEVEDYSYSLKFADRRQIQTYKDATSCDDIIMVRDWKITDMSYANIALLDGQQWVTPSQPMLAGTRLRQLLAQNRLIEREIYYFQLHTFQAIKPINSMLPFDETPAIPISEIVWEKKGFIF